LQIEPRSKRIACFAAVEWRLGDSVSLASHALKTTLTTRVNKNLALLKIWKELYFDRSAYDGEKILASDF
jgi:hypothetical protein